MRRCYAYSTVVQLGNNFHSHTLHYPARNTQGGESREGFAVLHGAVLAVLWEGILEASSAGLLEEGLSSRNFLKVSV